MPWGRTRHSFRNRGGRQRWRRTRLAHPPRRWGSNSLPLPCALWITQEPAAWLWHETMESPSWMIFGIPVILKVLWSEELLLHFVPPEWDDRFTWSQSPKVPKSFASTGLSFYKWETLVIDRLLLQLIFVVCLKGGMIIDVLETSQWIFFVVTKSKVLFWWTEIPRHLEIWPFVYGHMTLCVQEALLISERKSGQTWLEPAWEQ